MNALAGRLQWKKFALPATDAYSRVENVSPAGVIFQGIHSALAACGSRVLGARVQFCSRAIEYLSGAGTQADSGLHFNRVGDAHTFHEGLPEPGRSKNKSCTRLVFAGGYGGAAGSAEAIRRLQCAD